MTAPTPSTAAREGWHMLHLFLRVRGGVLASLPPAVRAQGVEAVRRAIEPGSNGIARSLAFSVLGHKADLGLVLAAPDARNLFAAQRAVLGGPLGPALEAADSFVSLTEVSEYVPAERVAAVREERLRPPFPPAADFPVVCFYPMSKRREDGRNWFALPFEERARLMEGHGRIGRAFAGRVKQVITAATGLDDWEWGVTLFGRAPDDLKEIVYKMRFDEVSARYALFGPFYYGPVLDPAGLARLLGV